MIGAATGTLGAVAYYSDPIRPLAHTVGLWITACVVVAFAEPLRPAIIRCTTLLAAAVVVFYVGRPIFYQVNYPGARSYGPDYDRIVLWLGFAVVAGIAVGYLLHLAGREGWWGAAGTAGAAGLLIGDAAAGIAQYPLHSGIIGLLTLVGCGLLVGFTVARLDGPGARLGRTAVLVAPLVLLGILAVSVPDLIEQLLVGA